MLRVVIDTTIILASVLTPGGPAAYVVDRALEGERVQAFYDDRMIAEYDEVLRRPRFGLPAQLVTDHVRLVGACFERVVVPPVTGVPYADPDDAPFIETAVAANVDFIVSRNHKHIKPYFPNTVPPGKLRMGSDTYALARIIRQVRGGAVAVTVKILPRKQR